MSEHWLAIEFPHLALDLVLRGHSPGRELPVAVSDRDIRRPAVLDCNPAAARLGVRPGMPLQAALGLAGSLHLAERQPQAEQDALERLAAWAYQYSSHVSLRPDWQALMLEAGGSRRLFGAPASLARRLARTLSALGYHVRCGDGPTPEAARLAARLGLSIDDREALRQQLKEVPLADLPLEPDQRMALEKMGFRQTAEVLRLPRKALARRLGTSLLDYLDRLRGARPDPQRAWRPAEHYANTLELPAEVRSARALLFPLRRMIDELCGVLRAGDRAIQELRIELGLEQGRERLRLGLQRPGRDEKRLLGLLRERIERLRLTAPVRRITLEAKRLLPYDAHPAGLFPDAPEPGNDPLQPLLERLRARLGRNAVAGLRGVQDHRPEHSWALQAPGEPSACQPLPDRPLWLYHPPRRCRIEEFEVLAGPERIESGWWDGADCRRDYFIVRDLHGSTLWAYREYKPRPGWYLHGLFG